MNLTPMPIPIPVRSRNRIPQAIRVVVAAAVGVRGLVRPNGVGKWTGRAVVGEWTGRAVVGEWLWKRNGVVRGGGAEALKNGMGGLNQD